MGRSGEGVLALGDSGAPPGSGRTGDRSAGGTEGDTAGKPAGDVPAVPEPGSDPLAAVASALDGDDTVGSVLPWILLAQALGVLGWGWVRYRARRRHP